MPNAYFKPCNAGLESETGSACRRMAKLLNALSLHVNPFIAEDGEGTVVREIWEFRTQLITKLKDEGWRVTATEHRWMSVLPSKAKKGLAA